MTYSTHPSYLRTMKQLRMAQTSPDHLLTSLTEKKNTKSNGSSHTDSSDDQNGCNTSSNGSQLIKFMPPNWSSITNPQKHISHPQPSLSQQPEKYISQHHPNHI